MNASHKLSKLSHSTMKAYERVRQLNEVCVKMLRAKGLSDSYFAAAAELRKAQKVARQRADVQREYSATLAPGASGSTQKEKHVS